MLCLVPDMLRKIQILWRVSLPTIMEGVQARVQTAVNGMIDTLDKEYFRKMQVIKPLSNDIFGVIN